MAQQPPRTGVCLVRIEAQDTSFLITVRRIREISTPGNEVVTRYFETEPALIAVRDFLEQFTACTQPP
jgi:hypothetical protein